MLFKTIQSGTKWKTLNWKYFCPIETVCSKYTFILFSFIIKKNFCTKGRIIVLVFPVEKFAG